MGTVDSHIARRKHQTTKMPGGKSTTNSGTNSGGNNYRAYSDGGYAYSNKGSSGNTTSTYYDTGAGHSFYTSKSGGYSTHTNQNTGASTTTPTNSKKVTGVVRPNVRTQPTLMIIRNIFFWQQYLPNLAEINFFFEF